MSRILVVNKQNEVVGDEDFYVAQKKGFIHRIVRLLLFNSKEQIFLQKRSMHAHSAPGLWDQSAGGWVDMGETNLEAITRESKEELSLDNAEFHEVGAYYTDTDINVDGEHLKRFNILYTAVSDAELVYDPVEVAGGAWMSVEELRRQIKGNPDEYTDGLRRALDFYEGDA